jgi:hypothetical protein
MKNVHRIFVVSVLIFGPVLTNAATFDASGWTVSANARQRGDGVSVSGNVKGPRCGLLRLDIFTHDEKGRRGHVIAQIKGVGGSPRIFSGADKVYGGGTRVEVSSVYATCQG